MVGSSEDQKPRIIHDTGLESLLVAIGSQFFLHPSQHRHQGAEKWAGTGSPSITDLPITTASVGMAEPCCVGGGGRICIAGHTLIGLFSDDKHCVLILSIHAT